MCTGAELIPLIGAIGAIGGAGINYFGTQSAAKSQSNAANNAANLGLQGSREAIQFQKDIYNSDLKRQYEAAQYLKGLLPNFDMNLPNPNSYFGAGNINNAFDMSKSSLNQQYQTSLGEAGTGAGEMAASRGLLNPSLMIRQAQNDVNQTYAPQFAGLEANRAGALIQNNKDLYQALLSNDQYLNMLRQLGYTNQFNLTNSFGSPNGSVPLTPPGGTTPPGGQIPSTGSKGSFWTGNGFPQQPGIPQVGNGIGDWKNFAF